VSLLITWPDNSPSVPVQETADPAEISASLNQIGCRFERRSLVADVTADADPDAVLTAYREIVEKLVAEEGFVKVDVATIHPSDDPQWPVAAEAMRAKFIDEHTHGDDDEVRFMVRGSGVFFLHIGDQVHAIYAAAGDLLGVPKGTTHWFDTGVVPDFTAIRFFHDKQGWVGISTGNDIATRFPDASFVRERAAALGGA